MRKQVVIYILVILGFWSCRTDFEMNIATPQKFEPELLEDFERSETIVISTLVGFVKDESANPLANALVTLNGTVTETDVYGHFFFTEVPMNAEGSTVSITLSSYHVSSKLFYPSADAIEHMDVIMTPIMSDDEIDGLVSGSVLLHGDVVFEYTAEAFLSADGSIYNEMVSIQSTLSPVTETDFAKAALGNFEAVDIENNLVGLKAQALFRLQFLDETGNRLRIKEDANLTLTIPQDSNVEALAAWYYAPSFGLYTVNNSIEKETDAIKVSLKHHTSILLASAYNAKQTSYKLYTENGIDALENVSVEVLALDETPLYSAQSNNQGKVQVSANESIETKLRIKDACGNLVYDDVLLSALTNLNLESVSLKSLDGDLYDCAVSPIQNGVIAVQQGQEWRFHYVANSTFSLRLQTCDQGSALVQGFADSIQGIVGTNLDLAQAQPVDILAQDNLGDLFTCADPSINQLRIENTNTGEIFVIAINNTDGSGPTNTSFGSIVSSEEQLRISFAGNEAGNYDAASAHSIERIWNDTEGYRYAGDAETFEVFRFGNIDKITIGEFEGVFRNTLTNQDVNLKGNFNFYFTE